MARKGDGGSPSGERLEKLLVRDTRARSSLAGILFLVLMIGAIVLGSCYAAFVAYLAVMHTETWLQKLRLVPLWVLAITVSLLGAVLVRLRYHVEIQPS